MRTSSKPWYRKQNHTWYVEIAGKQVRLSKDKAEAKRKWLKLLSQGGLPKDRPLRECVEHYLPRLAPRTRRTREQTLTAFLKHTGEISVGKLTKQHVRSFLKPGWSASTVRGHIKTVIACLSQAVRDGLIEENPVKDIEKPAWERREKILTAEELAKLLAAAREPFKTLLKAMADSGCRPGEICSLKVENCFPDQSIWLVANKTKNKTGVRERPVYLTPELAELTRSLIGGRTEGYLFLNRDGNPWTTDTVRCRFRNLREKLGLSDGAIPYGTRHRFASDAINRQKMDSLVVARLLGHSDARMLEKTYFREDTDAMVEAVKKATGK
ncbi:MAG: tyrosine-type recombinase/integrase [Isosphaeraceae bacterium]